MRGGEERSKSAVVYFAGLCCVAVRAKTRSTATATTPHSRHTSKQASKQAHRGREGSFRSVNIRHKISIGKSARHAYMATRVHSSLARVLVLVLVLVLVPQCAAHSLVAGLPDLAAASPNERTFIDCVNINKAPRECYSNWFSCPQSYCYTL